MAIFNVLDYGAFGDGIHDDTAAIALAINAASVAGGGTVYMPGGTYLVTAPSSSSKGAIELVDNITLQGDGMGETIIKLADNQGALSGILRTPSSKVNHDVTVLDLTIDGNRDNQTHQQNGFFCGVSPGSPLYDENITVERVEIMNCSGYGFDPHEITRNLVMRDNVAHGNGLDGFTLDFQVDAVVENCVAYNNGVHGFLIVTTSDDVRLVNCVSYGNGSSGLTIASGSQNTHVIGGAYHDNAGSGIYARGSGGVEIEGADIYGNGQNGINIGGTKDVHIHDNRIFDNSQAGSGLYSGILMKDWTDQATGAVLGTQGVVIEDNEIFQTTSIRLRFGIEERDPQSDGNTATGNQISGFARTAIQFRPDLVTPLADQTAALDAAFSFVVPANAFVDPEGAKLTYQAKLADGSALPVWLAFDANTRTFSGTPHSGDVGALNVTVTAKDQWGVETDTFALRVAAPVTATDDRWVISNNTFAKIGVATLLANDTGATAITSVGPAVGGMAGIIGDVVNFKAPAFGSAGFAYTASNANGGSGQGQVAVTVVNTTEGNDTLSLGSIASGAPTYIDGKGGNDLITGGAGADTLLGSDGNDTLNGAAGIDNMAGGNGNDTYYVGTKYDVVTEWTAVGQGGTDTVISTVDWTLGANFENLVLANLAKKGIGNAEDNELIGNAVANILNGGAGDDTLSGGAATDQFVFAPGAGHDVVTDFEDGLDRLDFRGTGLTFANLIIGSTGDDALVWYGNDRVKLIDQAGVIDQSDFLFS